MRGSQVEISVRSAIGTGAIALFHGIEPKELARLERLARPRQFEVGHVIVREGDTGIALFTIVRGKVRVTLTLKDGTERELKILGPGDSFGEMALFSGRRRSATITALEPVECLVLHRFDFLDELRKYPDVAIRLLDTMSQRLTESNHRS